MREELLREIAQEYLAPFFSGARILERVDVSGPREQTVSIRDPLSIAFKVNRADSYRLVLTRSQPFSSSAEPVIREIEVVRCFVATLAKIEHLLDGDLKHDLLSTFQRRVVARAVKGVTFEDIILSAIDRLAKWGDRLYEGAPISSAIGFKPGRAASRLTLSQIGDADFMAVLSNGFDTLLEFNYFGEFLTQASLNYGEGVLASFCPMRQSAIAGWTEDADRVGLSLNRLGEVLVFQQGQLVFARRSARWHFLTHEPVIMQMGVPRDYGLRRAIYETCLDASFARTGACIGIVKRDRRYKWRSLVAPSDQLDLQNSEKTLTLARIIRGKGFARLDRRTRQELAAIDGATIIAHDGTILAVGAILKIGGGSSGGGRLAASKAIGRLGLGIKVSQDGGISGFRDGEDEPVFRVM